MENFNQNVIEAVNTKPMYHPFLRTIEIWQEGVNAHYPTRKYHAFSRDIHKFITVEYNSYDECLEAVLAMGFSINEITKS